MSQICKYIPKYYYYLLHAYVIGMTCFRFIDAIADISIELV